MSAWITGPIKSAATTGIGSVTAKQVNDTSRTNQGVAVMSLDTNTDTIYLGGPDVTAANGWPLKPGHWFSIAGDPDKLYAISASGTQELRAIFS